MSDPNAATKKEEVLVMTGVRARMAAYQQEIQRKDKVPKKYAPIFKVADDLGASFHSTDGVPVRDKKPVDEGDVSMSANMDGTENEDDDENNGDVDHVFQRSMNASGRLDFSRSGDHSMTLNGNGEDDLIEEEPEKPQQVKDDEEKQAKENLGRLLGPDPEADDEKDNAEPVVLQAFSSVQRRYLKAVSKLRPQPFEFKKPEAKEAMPEAKAEIKKTLGREMDKSRHLTELTTTWDDYYEKAQDKPTEEVELQRVEEEVKQVEEEINNEWSNYAEKVVEVVVELQEEAGGDGDDNSVMSEDSDMVQWREEARRLKAEADQRKKQKADREERKKKRKQIAEIRKKRAAAAAARKKAEAAKDDEAAEAAKQQAEEEAKKRAEEAAQKKAEEEAAARLQAEEEARAKAAEEDAKKNDSPDGSDSSESSESVDSEAEKKTGGAKEKPMMEKSKSPEPPSQKKKAAADKSGGGGGDSDSDTSNENTKKTKKTKKKKDKDKEKAPKDKDGKKRKAKKAAGKKKGGGDNDDSDMEDGVPEEYPRNLDGSLWKNPLKFWTNKPKKLNEIAPKVIMRPNSNSDVFCKSEDAINDNACFYWHKFEGDFNVLVKIKGDLKTSYDKAGIMIRQDERNWVMSGLEFFNKRINHSSCITRGISDWSLAPLPVEAKDGIWIAIKRHDNKVECFYSFDLKEWIQTRQGLFPTDKVVKVGIVAACPMGEPFKVVFERFRIQMVG